MKKKLIKALCYIPEGQYVSLGDDTFLTGLLDGSEKIYGFGRLNGELVVINSNSEYPIDGLTTGDLRYIFNLSSPNIYEKIKTYQYFIEHID